MVTWKRVLGHNSHMEESSLGRYKLLKQRTCLQFLHGWAADQQLHLRCPFGQVREAAHAPRRSVTYDISLSSAALYTLLAGQSPILVWRCAVQAPRMLSPTLFWRCTARCSQIIHLPLGCPSKLVSIRNNRNWNRN
jgi:hypothetical protein